MVAVVAVRALLGLPHLPALLVALGMAVLVLHPTSPELGLFMLEVEAGVDIVHQQEELEHRELVELAEGVLVELPAIRALQTQVAVAVVRHGITLEQAAQAAPVS
jgi:hypothetical protein